MTPIQKVSSRTIAIRNATIIAILATVNALFVLKYSVRYSPSLAPLALVYFICLVFLVVRIPHPRRALATNNKRLLALVLTGLCLGAWIAVNILPQESRVGRLPALADWLSNLTSGNFPYSSSAKPSGFPILFFLAYPFYVLGNLGYLQVAGLVLLSIYIFVNSKDDPASAWLQTITLLLLPTTYYEVLVRSELLFNMSLALALILLADACLRADRMDWRFTVIAVLFGLVLSTRSIVGLVYIIYIVHRFRTRPVNGLGFSAIALLVFFLALVPFVIWDSAAFFAGGPFSIQLAYLPFWITLLFACVAAAIGWRAHDSDPVYAAGLALFAVAATALVLALTNIGFSAAILKDGFDISYLIFCVPFLVVSLREPGERDKSGLSTISPY